MAFQNDTFMGSDGETLITYSTMVPSSSVKGVVQIVHGMCEYMDRYTDLAQYLADKGYSKYLVSTKWYDCCQFQSGKKWVSNLLFDNEQEIIN